MLQYSLCLFALLVGMWPVYYITWFKTGQPPKIPRDAMHYLHRIMKQDSALTRPQDLAIVRDDSPRPVDIIEILNSPYQAELLYRLGSSIWSEHERTYAPSGLASLSPVHADNALGEPVWLAQ